MRHVILPLVALALVAVPAVAQFQEILDQADRLHKQDQFEQSRLFLEGTLARAATDPQRAELQWRLARAWLNLGDQAEDRGVNGQDLLSYFEKGEAAADKAIALDPENHLGYYWKSGNIGRWGQVKGILNALNKARPMQELLRQALRVKPDHADSYYVLGQLYEQVPGFPLSFGNKDYAVSLGRLAVDLRERQVKAGLEEELDYDFYTELARHLWERNWDASRRQRDQKRKAASYRSAASPLDKGCFYEATLTLDNISDRQEALRLARWTAAQLQALPGHTGSKDDDLEEVRELLASWK
jgi:tetratricopeptide (TPR) repeat protein